MNQEVKIKLARIVSALTPVAMKFENISEPESAYSFSSEHKLQKMDGQRSDIFGFLAKRRQMHFNSA